MAEPAIVFQSEQRRDFERFRQERHEPAFITRLREAGLGRYESLGFPNIRQEQWRATDLSRLAASRFVRAADVPVDAARLPPALAANSIRLVFVNGRYAPGLSQLPELSGGIIVTSLAQAVNTHPALLEQHLERIPGLDVHPFSALNSAFMEDGVLIHLPAGNVLEQPVHLVFYASGDNTSSYPRNLIVLGEATELTLIEDYRGTDSYFTCPVTDMTLAPGAVCRYYKHQHEAVNAFHLSGSRFQQSSDSSFEAHFITSAGALNRNDIITRLNGSGASCSLHGLTLVADGELGDFHVTVEHSKPHGSSRQMFKSILDGKSRAVFDGIIKVVKDAQKTDAAQSSRNLLLSKRAIANANPRLEILADDVSCSHGSTTGFLDPDALFYLRSRGLGERQAKALLVYGFAHEQIEAIRLQALRDRLEKLLLERFTPTA
jgi:Fe-S cluster assembly protein SufD